MSQLRTIVAVFAGLAIVAVFFAALVAADDPPTKCPPVPGRTHRATGIVSRDVGPGKLSCAQVRHLLRRWIRLRFPERLGGWTFRYRPDCSCHFATRVVGGQPLGFAFS